MPRHSARPNRGRWIAMVLLATTVIASVLAATWPADRFKVLTRGPTLLEIRRDASVSDVVVSAMFEAGGGGDTPQTLNSAQAAGWGNEILAYFKRAGHRPPELPVYGEPGQTQYYRLYIFPFADSISRHEYADARGAYGQACPGSIALPWISLNHDLTRSQLPKVQYWSISHEFMHALNYGDKLFDDCVAYAFEISEGIPDGAAAYLANRKWSNFSGGVAISNSASGSRSYQLPLFNFTMVPEKQKSTLEIHQGYATSSFWHFLIERFGGLQIIPHFTSESLPTKPDHEAAYRWLDKGLQTWPALSATRTTGDQNTASDTPGLYEVFPAFIAEFASYGGARYKGFDWRRFGDEQAASRAWLTKTLGACKELELTPGKKIDHVTLTVSAVAARCLRVRYVGFQGPFISKIEVLHTNLKHMDAIHLGWAWKHGDKEENCFRKRKAEKQKWPPCTYKAFVQHGPAQGLYARTWPSEDIDPQGSAVVERIYVLSNVAVDPWKTKTLKNLTFKVGVSSGVVKGVPAQPVQQLNVPRKGAAINPVQRVGPTQLYGLQTNPPLPATGLLGLSLFEPKRESTGTPVTTYTMTFRNLRYGMTGPVRGMIAASSNSADLGRDIVSSAVCKSGPNTVIGEVVQSDEDALHIRLNASLCRAGSDTTAECGSPAGCPVVDTVTGEHHIAFGWRQFPETAATDILTRGTQRYINTMPDSWQEAMTFGVGSELPDSDDPSFVPGPGSITSGTGNGSVGGRKTLPNCSCSCDEREQSEQAARELKARHNSGIEMSMAELAAVTRCSNTCQREYMVCAMQADDARKAKKKAARREAERKLSANCDCSCEGIALFLQQSKALQQAPAIGKSADINAIMQLSQCATTCHEPMMTCYKEGRIK